MNMRKPLVIEFVGTPNSGKTVLIGFLQNLLSSMDYKVEVMQEDAEIVPSCIPKKTFERNLWITSGQIQSLIESKYSSADIVLFDRGFIDAKFWANFLHIQNVCSAEDSKFLSDFLDNLDKMYHFLPDYLFVIDVSTDVSLKRRYANMQENEVLVFSNDSFIDLYRNELNKLCNNLTIPMFYLDTSNLSLIQMQEIVLQKVTEILENHC